MPNDGAQLLSEVWGGKGFPVDPVWIANRLGIKVVQASLPGGVSGAIIKERGNDPVIVIESSDSKNRRRVACAHAIGHFVGRSKLGAESYEYVDLRGSSQGIDEEESFANRFAESLLMPEDVVRRWQARGERSVIMAYWFGVPGEVMGKRLEALSLRKL